MHKGAGDDRRPLCFASYFFFFAAFFLVAFFLEAFFLAAIVVSPELE